MPESMTIAVAGATGRVGSRIVELLNVGGHDVVPMSPSTGMAVVTEGVGEGVGRRGVCHRRGQQGLARPTSGRRVLHRLGAPRMIGQQAGVQRHQDSDVDP